MNQRREKICMHSDVQISAILQISKILSWISTFVPHDATQSAVMPQYVVCLSCHPCVTFRNR